MCTNEEVLRYFILETLNNCTLHTNKINDVRETIGRKL